MDLGVWLRSLGLERYEAAFRENEIDAAILPSLTAEDLKELGVGPIGHRRKLLDAIAALGTSTSTKIASADTVPTIERSKDTAERRQVTVMFSDLVGSTALATRMDPEDLRELISAYQKCVTETVRRFDGFVAKYMGDGVLAYFGYPQAHEDDAERAVRAGLALVAAVAGLKMRTSLQSRVGIATGLVVVGELIGSGEALERGIVGETPNLAARLQGIAEPDTVVIADDTQRLLGSLFELEDLGPRNLKGIAAPVRAWAALRPSSVESRFEALHWGKAGQRSLSRSALPEAVAQLTRALGQIAALPPTAALRREQIKLQVALITPLIHVKGYAAPETKAAVDQARLLIERAEALEEPLEDPLLLFAVLYGFWVANCVAFNGDVMLDLAAQFLALAERQAATVPLMIGHRLKGISLLNTGDIAEGWAHLDRAIALYDTTEHRPLATRFGQDVLAAVLSYRSWALWTLGYPDAALADVDHALRHAREIGQAPTLMYALAVTSLTLTHCGYAARTMAQLDELTALADEKAASFWKAFGMTQKGCVSALIGKGSDAVPMITSWITVFRATGSTYFTPFHLSSLAKAYARLGQFDDAWRCIGEAITAGTTTKERWCEAEVHRVAGEIALMSPEPNAANAETSFERALEIARARKAKSWELRAATSMARLWHDQGHGDKARQLLVPIYSCFADGFNTLDLKQAKALLDSVGA
jgi:class 3 adenylate cyclase/predicted ATPase